MALGKAEGSEALELLPYLVCGRADDPVRCHSFEYLITQTTHCLIGTLVCHGRSQPIGLVAVEARADPGQFHQLLLKDRDAQGLPQHRLCQRMRKPDFLLTITPA